MAEPESTVETPIDEIDVNTEKDEELIARKIESDLGLSVSYYQTLKEKYTDYYFDFLSYRDEANDPYKSNTFIPLPYIALLVIKAAIKRAILATHPYGRIIPEPFDPDLSWKLSLFYDSLLEDARYRKFVDIAVQDCLIYGNAVYQVTWEQEYKPQPQFQSDWMGNLTPAFDESGERIWADELVRDGVSLTNIHIQDFYLPAKALEAESAPWNAIIYRKGLSEFKEEDGYQNLDLLRELRSSKRQDTNETQRYEEAMHKPTGHPSKEEPYDIYQYVTDEWIFHKPAGANFLIKRERNPYKQKPFHIAQIIPLNSEPYGLSPMAEGHLMAHTINEIIDVIMDQLFLEDEKFFVVNRDKVNDFEMRARQGNIAHVEGLEQGDDVRRHVWAVETRALATEIFPLLQFLYPIYQKVSGGVDTLTGVPAQGAETAYENSLVSQGALSRVPDYLDGLEDTLGQPLFADIGHLLKLYMNEPKKVQQFGDGGEVNKELDIIPQEVWSNFKIKLEWVGRERSRIEERAQLNQMLQITGTMANWNEVTGIILENLLVLSDIKDLGRIKEAIQKTIAIQQQIMAMQAMGKGGSPEGAAGGTDDVTKMIGDALGGSVNAITPEESGGGMI